MDIPREKSNDYFDTPELTYPDVDPLPTRPPHPHEAARIAETQRLAAAPPVTVKVCGGGRNPDVLAAPHSDAEGHRQVLQQALGSASPDFVASTLERLTRVADPYGRRPNERNERSPRHGAGRQARERA